MEHTFMQSLKSFSMCRIKSAAQHLGVCGMCSGKWPNKVNYLGLERPKLVTNWHPPLLLKNVERDRLCGGFSRPLLCWRNALQLSEQKMK